MFFTEQKLQGRIRELAGYRYRDARVLDAFLAKRDCSGLVNPEAPSDFSGWDKMPLGADWKGRDLYLWLHADAEIPAEWAGKRVVGVFDFGMTGEGNNLGFESLCFVDGKPYQGVDVNHKEVFLGQEVCGRSVSLTFRLWSGLEGGGEPREMEHRLREAFVGWLDEETDDLYYLASMVLGTVEQLSDSDPVRHELLANLNRAFLALDWSYPGSEAFYDSVRQADRLLNDSIGAMEKHSDIHVYTVGHTHIDTAWLWRLKNTREKCGRSFHTVMRLMEMFPEYFFLQTQPQLYEWVKQDYPELYEQIKERVREGRWEADGAMWVEADCNLTSGESLTRQILLGSRFIQEEFGKEVEFLWLPDVFGYSWALPQILKKSGIDMFMTTKISWNQYNRMPHDTFYWKGIDGSRVLTHFITTPEPERPADSWFYTYNGRLVPRTVKGVWDGYSEKDMNRDLLISYGFGDGGGGVNRDMLEQRRRLDKIPGLPHVTTSTAGTYFRKLKENVEKTDQYVNTWDGELYLEYHRGTYTSHAHNKRMNRKMELLYREAEYFTVLRALLGKNLALARQERLTEGWKHLLTDQFHDIIPGSSIFEVYEDSKKDYEWISQVGQEVEEDFFAAALRPEKDCFTVFNSSGFAAGGAVLLPGVAGGQAYLDGTGDVLESQRTPEGLLVWLPGAAATGTAQIRIGQDGCEEGADAAQKTESAPFLAEGRRIETPFYVLELNEAGQIARLYDKEFEREVLPKGQCANVLQVFEDKPMGNDAWDIDIFYQEKMREIRELTAFELRENGPVRLRLHLEWIYMNSRIRQDMLLYAHSRRIDFETEVEYHERHQLLKAAFPADVRTTYGTFDVQYGNVRRPNNWNTSWEQAKFETVAHRFADLSEYGYGVSLLNDCKYGHDVKDNVLRLSLIKAATYPDHSQDQGLHRFTYALLPHGGDFIQGRTVQEAEALNWPLRARAGRAQLPFRSFLEFDRECAELDAVKKTEDGKYLAVRFHDFTGGTNRLTLKPGFAWKRCCAGDLRERPLEAWRQADETGQLQLTVKPYEIVTLLFEV
ncbi:MAG: alpha-mannosidase [Eubacteriales bacterium]|nr:alpha-mannosidase [Eubacteriales bacterium]